MTMAHPLSINRTAPVLQVNGAPLAASALAALMELRITRGLRLPGRATLRFDDAGHALAAGGTFAIGATVSVAAEVALPGAPGTPVVTAGVGTLDVTVAPPTSG